VRWRRCAALAKSFPGRLLFRRPASLPCLTRHYRPRICPRGCIFCFIAHSTMFFPTLLRRAAALPKFDFARNPYKAKRTWPPDFTKLSQKHQFRLERRYRRRAKLKWARPTWTKFVKLSTWATISCMYTLKSCDEDMLTLCSVVVVYGLLFMDIEEGTVFGTVCRLFHHYSDSS
jgi:hypothetical protein